MIGIFDSGAGGMSVLREILKLLPQEKYVYYSDNANCPYGEKTREFIIERSRAITRELLGKGCGIIVVACNTATSAAIETLREEFAPVKFIGMEPAIKPAVLSTRTGVIGVLATAGTLKGSKYLISKGIYEDDVRIEEHVGQGYVELVENGELEGPHAEEVVRKSLQPLLDAGADNIVLGCTHYPFLRPLIRKIAGPSVKILDPAPATARHLIYVMVQEKLISETDATHALAKVIELAEAADRNEEPGKAGLQNIPDIELISSGDPQPLKNICRQIL
ncbi:MAG: glutamate racemase [Bacteroidales bacterium]|nr:glutamate racemase [Bacteroidales bacterium]